MLASKQLFQNLAKDGYYHILGTSGLWKHRTRCTRFVSCIDDFAIKYYSKEDLDHFLKSVAKHYEYYIDRSGSNYIGLKLDWDYGRQWVNISMPNYIPKLLKRLEHKTRLII